LAFLKASNNAVSGVVALQQDVGWQPDQRIKRCAQCRSRCRSRSSSISVRTAFRFGNDRIRDPKVVLVCAVMRIALAASGTLPASCQRIDAAASGAATE